MNYGYRTRPSVKLYLGYRYIYSPGHPRSHTANYSGLTDYVQEHVLIAEKAIGYYLDAKHPIHHIDENRINNQNNNLVICEDQSYHQLLHYRMKVLLAGGILDKHLFCPRCKLAKLPVEFAYSSRHPSGRQSYCRKCNTAYKKQPVKV